MTRLPMMFGYHFPKTGGTSLSFNFSQAFGEDRILREGPHARRQKFFARLPQTEELLNSEWDHYRVVYGHGVTDRLIPLLPHSDIDLIFVVREPLSLFASRIKHYRTMQSRVGDAPMPIEALKQDYTPNDMARRLVEAYGSFVEGEASVSEDSVRQILECVRVLMCTEKLTDQMRRLNADLGLPAPAESRRVSADKTEILPDDVDAFRRDNELDYKLYSLALERGSVAETDCNSRLFREPAYRLKLARTRAGVNRALSFETGLAATIDALVADAGLEAALIDLRHETAAERRNHGLYLHAVEEALPRYKKRIEASPKRIRNDLQVLKALQRHGDYGELRRRAKRFIEQTGGDERGVHYVKVANRHLGRSERQRQEA